MDNDNTILKGLQDLLGIQVNPITEPQCTCTDTQKQRPLCPVCDKEKDERNKIEMAKAKLPADGFKYEFPKPYEDVYNPGDILMGYDPVKDEFDHNLQICIKYKKDDGTVVGEYIYPVEKRFGSFIEKVEKIAPKFKVVCNTTTI